MKEKALAVRLHHNIKIIRIHGSLKSTMSKTLKHNYIVCSQDNTSHNTRTRRVKDKKFNYYTKF